MDVVVNPPVKGEPSYDSFMAQKTGTLQSLAERAKLVADTFNSIDGFTCQTVQGAMYAFPRVSQRKKLIWLNPTRLNIQRLISYNSSCGWLLFSFSFIIVAFARKSYSKS